MSGHQARLTVSSPYESTFSEATPFGTAQAFISIAYFQAVAGIANDQPFETLSRFCNGATLKCVCHSISGRVTH
jgi:hypothetical protein